MITKKSLVEAINNLGDSLVELEVKVEKLEDQAKSDKVMIDGLTKKVMAMENKLCTCKPDPELEKKKKLFDKQIEHRAACLYRDNCEKIRLKKSIKAIKQPRDKTGKFVKKK